MKILLLLHDFTYPPIAGAPWQAFNLLRYLASRHECHVLALAEDVNEGTIAEMQRAMPQVRVLGVYPSGEGLAHRIKGTFLRRLPRWCVGGARAAWYVWQYQIAAWFGRPPHPAYWRKDFARAIVDAVGAETYDVVHIETIMLARYRRYCGDVPAVACPYDSLAGWAEPRIRAAVGFDRAWWRVCGWALKRHERRAFRGFNAVCLVSAGERRRLLDLNESLETETVPISVDEAFLAAGPLAGETRERTPARRLFFPTSSSLIDAAQAAPLIQFLREGFQALRRQHDVLAIVAHGPTTRAIHATLSGIPGVVMAGWVENYVDALREADAVVFTERTDNGTKNRVLQAMAAGKPVVTSTPSAAGIDGVDGVHLWMRDTPADVAGVLDDLFRDPDLAPRIGAAAREFARSRFSIDVVGPRWEALYARTIARAAMARG